MTTPPEVARSAADAVPPRPAMGPLVRFARTRILARLDASIVTGRLELHEPDGTTHVFGQAEDAALALVARLEVRDPSFWWRVATGGSLGVADAWAEGSWTSPDLEAVLRLMVRNLDATDAFERGGAWGQRVVSWLRHAARHNSARNSRRNIFDHYDIGNDFFRTFLDETMTYSCGVHVAADDDLAAAQIAKLDRICRKLRLGPDDHVLEIGCGWGSFAIHAARTYGCRVTGTTISEAQHEIAVARAAEAGVADRVAILRTDYRHLTGTFDAVVSIEMIEAVGHRYLPTYFGVISERLRPGGRACIQAITMPDHRYAQYRRTPDFIQRVMFPGSCCPSLGAMTAAMGRRSDLRVVDAEDIGPHYATTLRQWWARFDAAEAELRDLGYDDRFMRTWQYYFAYCAAGFAERYIGDLQLVLVRPGATLPHGPEGAVPGVAAPGVAASRHDEGAVPTAPAAQAVAADSADSTDAADSADTARLSSDPGADSETGRVASIEVTPRAASGSGLRP